MRGFHFLALVPLASRRIERTVPKPQLPRLDLHAAPKTEIVARETVNDVEFVLVQMQSSKTDVWHSLHVRPNFRFMSGIQSTDILDYLGFERNACSFVANECYVKAVPPDFDLSRFAQAFHAIARELQQAQQHLNACGIFLDEPQGPGFFFGKITPASRRYRTVRDYRGDGHTASTTKRMKALEDENFEFVLSWIESYFTKGWTTHYRPKHPPLSPELEAAFAFLGMQGFSECPEFEFEPCMWRFATFQGGQFGAFDSNAGEVNTAFAAHESDFSAGVQHLLGADLEARQFDMSILPGVLEQNVDGKGQVEAIPTGVALQTGTSRKRRRTEGATYPFEVAISFAGPQRELAEQLANQLRQAGHTVFYDNYYPEQLWGKDLTVFFDDIFRKQSRYCVIFVSSDYAQRMWTSHEHQSARARAVEQIGTEYILPIRVDSTELAGMPPTVGYLSLSQYSIDEVVQILLRKLQDS